MITKSEWQSVRRDLAEADRKKLGAPPSAEEILAYTNGELPPADEERVRHALVAWPELAATLAAPFPEDDGGAVSGETIDRQWTQFQRQMTRADAAPPRISYGWLAVAATLALVFAGLYVRATREVERLSQPHVISSEHLLLPSGTRGAEDAATLVRPGGGAALLRVFVPQSASFAAYRLELRGAQNVIWTGSAARGEEETISVLLPRELLGPGRYELVVYGVDGTREERLSSYALRVASSSP
jgi:anti-sigma factor RsiW